MLIILWKQASLWVHWSFCNIHHHQNYKRIIMCRSGRHLCHGERISSFHPALLGPILGSYFQEKSTALQQSNNLLLLLLLLFLVLLLLLLILSLPEAALI